ncbi:MAG: SusC/RagA family TonB-linked outer membrane protein [Sphingobacteriales bacterium]|nr:MAG: SusC/RagA family TonB-linked outer membrane protein [Sphingobacteriales bacterium]
MKKMIIIIVLATLWLIPKAKAQDYLITGTVKNQSGQPIAGANIATRPAPNQKQLTIQSGPDGSFSLKLSEPTGKLTITYLGYQRQTVTYTSGETLSITLTEDAANLKEVEINTGYYSVKQKQLTGSISSLKAETIEKQPVTNPLQALQGRITGAYVSQSSGTPSSSMNLIIRGRNSIESSTSPLYIIDGIPFASQNLTNDLSVSTRVYSSGGASPFNTISPDDIASIEILKDADATAIYGSRGANGVVLITTKKAKSGKTKIDLNAYGGISEATRTLQVMSTHQYLEFRRQALALDGTPASTTDYDLNGTWEQSKDHNWQKELLGGTAKFNNVRLSISGGNEHNSFLASGTYNSQGSVYQGNLGYDRATVHLASSHSSADQKFSASFSATYSADDTNWLNNDFVPRSLTLSPNAPEIRNPDGSLNWANSTWINPLRELESKYKGNNNNLLASAMFSYRPIKNLELKASLGYNQYSLTDNTTTPVSFYDPADGRTPAQSFSDFNDTKTKSYSIEPQASYTLPTKFGTFSFLSGMTIQRQQRDQLLLRGTGFASDALISSLRAAAVTTVRAYNNSTYGYSGVYARANYTLKDRYILNLTGRRDGSSRFGTGKQFANFGAIGAAYIFSEENWIREKLPILSFGKLRISYGTSGNDQIGDYEYLNTYASNGGYNGVAGLAPVRPYNPDFAWELNKKLELGLDFGLLKDRIRGTIGYYRNRSSNQLINYPLAATTGFSSVRTNMGATVQNTGLEFELNAEVTKTKKFSWETSFNLTVPRNRLVSFPGLSSTTYANSYEIGRPLNISKLYNLLGVNPSTGLYEFQDYNSDGVISSENDRHYVVEKGQRYYGGWNNSLSYGNLQMDFLFQFVKQDLANILTNLNISAGQISNLPADYVGNTWLKTGDIAKYQRPSASNFDALTQFGYFISSNAVISDASFIRLKNVSLSYKNSKLIKNTPIRVYLQGQNLWTITNYFGLDPETANYSTPPLRTITLGLQLSL